MRDGTCPGGGSSTRSTARRATCAAYRPGPRSSRSRSTARSRSAWCPRPALGRRWWAARGSGAFADGDPIQCPKVGTTRRRDVCFANFRDWEPLGLGDAMLELGRQVWRRLASATSGAHARGRRRGGRDDRARALVVGRRRRPPGSSRRLAGGWADLTGGGGTRAGASPRTACCTTRCSRLLAPDERRGCRVSRTEVTVGIDIGTSSVKAIAADGDGNVVASVRVPHEFYVPSPGRFQHDAEVAWRRGPREALAAVATDLDVRGVSVAAMVPSLTAVDDDGIPVQPGLLYGDERARARGRRVGRHEPGRARRAAGLPRLGAQGGARCAWLLAGAGRRQPRPVRRRRVRHDDRRDRAPVLRLLQRLGRRDRRGVRRARRADAARRPDRMEMWPARRRRTTARVGLHRRARGAARRRRRQRR